MFQTQKVRGVKWLDKYVRTLPGNAACRTPIYAALKNEQVRELLRGKYDPYWDGKRMRLIAGLNEVFVRPCPVTPRHGFVDSRIVRSGAELVDVLSETLAADSGAEVILAKPIDAKYNYVITRNGITIGVGHDGATAGKGAVSLPIPTNLPNPENIISEWPYMEAVHDGSVLYLTQLRDGPETPLAKDFIPKMMRVEHIYVVDPNNNDLLKFEQEVRELPEGTVVVHEGGSLTSHFGVHCYLNGVPYITSFRPKVGDIIELAGSSGWDQEAFDTLAGYGRFAAKHYHYSVENYDNFVDSPAAFSIIHSVVPMMQHDPDDSVLRLLAWAMHMVVLSTAAASMAEVRHWPKINSYMYDERVAGDIEEMHSGTPREKAFEKAFSYDLERATVALHTAKQIFGKSWPPSYGGKRWKKSTERAIKIASYWKSFLNTGKRDHFDAAVHHAHAVLNEVHNGGPYLSKVMDTSEEHMDAFSSLSGLIVARSIEAARVALDGSWNTNEKKLRLKKAENIKKAESLVEAVVKLANEVDE